MSSSVSVSSVVASQFGPDLKENLKVLEQYHRSRKNKVPDTIFLHNNGHRFVLRRGLGFENALSLLYAIAGSEVESPFGDAELKILKAFYHSKLNVPEKKEERDPDHRVIAFLQRPNNASVVIPKK